MKHKFKARLIVERRQKFDTIDNLLFLGVICGKVHEKKRRLTSLDLAAGKVETTATNCYVECISLSERSDIRVFDLGQEREPCYSHSVMHYGHDN